ncbi:UNVERIFIED_CONTAM: hypothetical protein GTU68_060970 [Idotea baltica]|nr:hypothetical protein [Idotea baltica]
MSQFITFEGGEGSGKSTQARKLYEYLSSNGIKSYLTREPGGTELAEKLRNEILLKDEGVDDPLTEFMIISAARRDHVEKIIKPKLKEGIIVICDRFYDSSLAYQSYYKGLSAKIMDKVYKISLGDFQPDLTFFLDIDIQSANNRVDIRGKQNHYDDKGQEFNKVVLKAFRDIAAKNSPRIIKINADQEIEKVFVDILKKAPKYIK